MQIRIKWQSKIDPTKKGNGDWFDSEKLSILLERCAELDKMFPDLKHEIEFSHN